MRSSEMTTKKKKRPKRPRNVIAMMARTMRRGVLKHVVKRPDRLKRDENRNIDDKDDVDVSSDDSERD